MRDNITKWFNRNLENPSISRKCLPLKNVTINRYPEFLIKIHFITFVFWKVFILNYLRLS